jgi:hypothetical protein
MLLDWPPAALLIVIDHLRRGFGHFNLGAHFLDERFLLFQLCFESVNFLLLPLHSFIDWLGSSRLQSELLQGESCS